MKKTMLYAAAAAFIFSAVSCQKENLNENASNDSLVFTAGIECGIDTKTTLTSERKVNWETGDEISVNGVTYTATPRTDDAARADFAKNDTKADPTGPFNAYYPAELYGGGTPALPGTITYTDGRFNMPMYAASKGTSLSFKNICGVLAITIPLGTTVSKIVVSAPDKALSGTFTVKEATENAGDYYAELTEDAQTARQPVTLTLSSAVTLEAATTFYIPVPAQTYAGLKIKVYADDSEPTKCMGTINPVTTNPSITIARNTIYSMDYAPNAVQLWAGGPFFATKNVGGATSGADLGPTYEDKKSKSGIGYYGAILYTTVTDTIWGPNWDIPTIYDIANLVNKDRTDYGVTFGVNCTKDLCEENNDNGIRTYTGKGAYAGNSITLNCTTTISYMSKNTYSYTKKGKYYTDLLVLFSNGGKAPSIGISSMTSTRFARMVLKDPE